MSVFPPAGGGEGDGARGGDTAEQKQRGPEQFHNHNKINILITDSGAADDIKRGALALNLVVRSLTPCLETRSQGSVGDGVGGDSPISRDEELLVSYFWLATVIATWHRRCLASSLGGVEAELSEGTETLLNEHK